jgi:ribosomal protein S8
VKLNLITIVKKNINKNLIVDIYFQYIGGEPLFKNIKNLNKPSKTTLINYKQLLKINKKNNSLFIISTNKGLITNFEAEKYKIGGNIILKIII